MATQSIQIDDNMLASRASGLFSVLECLFPVSFHIGGGRDYALLGRISSTLAAATPINLSANYPALTVPATTQSTDDDSLIRTNIRFADDPEVPWPYRGRSITVRVELDSSVQAALAASAHRVLATDAEDRPIWTLADRHSVRIHRTALRLPCAQLGMDVGLAASEERFVQVLPLFHFLRQVTEPAGFSNPPLRAAFIIDDPNLHWPTYGYANYRTIAASAHRDRYHVALGTIPFDAWWVHGKTAEIFRTHPEELSLLIHGNNHARKELAKIYADEAIAALLQQAIARIRRLEARSGLNVSRVMVPPHGACSSRVLAELPHQGFESACISAASLRAHNTGQAWTGRLGLAPSELIEGCPVLPRWAFNGTSDTTLLAAAYLGQPLILRGHHQDLKDGLDLFREFAAKINALGDVRWGSLGELSRLNYRHRIEGSTMRVQPLGTRITVEVPDGIEAIQIDTNGIDWQVLQPQATLNWSSDCSAIASVVGGRTYDFARCRPLALVVRPNATSARLILRRFLTETRDRLRFN
jgi:hypothetical protein